MLTVLITWSSINTLTAISFSKNSAPDCLALLAFKEKINGDPFNVLSSWNDSIHFCDWNGVTCSRRHRDKVIVLDLESQKLEEYGMGGEVSTQGDIYSYGILLLELFTKKKPTDDMFQNGQNLHRLAKAALPEGVMTIVDPTMLDSTGEAINISNQSDRGIIMQTCLVSAIRLGVACSSESPFERLNIGEVVTELHHIREHCEGVRIHLE